MRLTVGSVIAIFRDQLQLGRYRHQYDLMAAFPLLYPLDNKKKEKQSLDEQILGAASRK